jgi:N-acetylmuramic acid 6-phosphate etherase
VNLPPDRSNIDTEQQNPHTANLHQLSVSDCVARIIEEDLAVHKAMEAAQPSLARLIEAAQPGFCAGGRLIYFGAGTSGRLGVLDASEAPPTFQVEPGRIVGIIAGGDGSLRKSSEGKEDEPEGVLAELLALQLTPQDTLIGIAAGGTTPYVRGGLEWAGRCKNPPLLTMISCSEIAAPAGVSHLIILRTGPEVLTGSTRMKAGTATKLALNIISTTLMIQEGRVYGNLMVDVRASNAKLRDRAARILSTLTGLERQEAFAQLEAAEGELKTALVMVKKKCGAEAARSALTQASLAKLLDGPQ